MIIKICGIKKINTIECCEKNKVDLFGLIFYKKSPRYVDLHNSYKLIEASLDKNIKPVGVFYNENIENVKSHIKNLNLEIIQLHGEESNNYIDELKYKNKIQVIKTVSIKEKKDLLQINNFNSNDYFLFDYKPLDNELPGGNAKKFDWKILSGLNINKPWFLSGGISIMNVGKIKNFLNPDGIDLSSGVEDSPGIKSNEKIDNLIKQYNA